ncbi:ribonuclease R [Microbulbifer agarilyticus]|uniref:ribonuclease R n=1 Tax=Microbulbifer agarilyticus TaxID=260552 RepID=UPI001CD79538|nr:ribonuclease R [Microbulbifer agarilyticus]MCA0892499.1 ribonuclease R [Microbulbifer agarilyticus]
MNQDKTNPSAISDDPHAEREAEKYEKPVPSREFLLDVLEQQPGPVAWEAVADLLSIDDEDRREGVRRRLIAMSRDGQIASNRAGDFGVLDKMSLVRGRVIGHRDGFGFVSAGDGSDDLFLSHRQMRKVFDGDEVLARETPGGFRGKREGAVVRVIKHNTQQLAGRLYREDGVCFVRPDNPRMTLDVLVAEGKCGDAQSGQYVVVNITTQPGRNNLPQGEVAEILGDHLAPGMEIDVAIRNYGIPHSWPAAVLTQTDTIADEVLEEDKEARIDLRQLPLVTIDGEDARDFDDAVYCELLPDGNWKLLVAIADVSHYVQINTALDQEAHQRGNSVYFPDFVVPMLPEKLSNGLCSLNPHVDRLCMVCEMHIDPSGNILNFQFFEGLMRSHARFTYTQVGEMVEERDNRDSGIRKQFAALTPHIDNLHDLYGALRGARDRRGAIDFETTETRIIFDAARKIERIVPVQRNDAHKMIEECMLAANVCAAELMELAELPALYRVHDIPKQERLENLREYLGELGLRLEGGSEPQPSHYQELLSQADGRPDFHIIQTMLLRSMNQAVYQPENRGHFGLDYRAYAHFTSPIRRYPDLLLHRGLRWLVRNGSANPAAVAKKVRQAPGAQVMEREQILPYTAVAMVELGEHCSMTERRADDATRDVVSWLKCEYLQDHVGEVYRGVISAVTGFGLFVELEDLYVEGLIHVTALPKDYYHFEQAQQRLVGERSGTRFHLGDGVTVQVARVDLEERKVDFTFVELHPRPSYQTPKYRKPKADKKADKKAGKMSDKKSRKQDDSKVDKQSVKYSVTGEPTSAPDAKSKAKKAVKKSRSGEESTQVSGRAMEMAVEFQAERQRRGKHDFSKEAEKASPWGGGLKAKRTENVEDEPRPIRKRKVGSDDAEVVPPSKDIATETEAGEEAAPKKRRPKKTPPRKGGKRPAVAARKAAQKAEKAESAQRAAKKAAKKKLKKKLAKKSGGKK